MRLTPKNELDHRYRQLQQYMAGEGLDAVLMVQNADLFYFTGTIQSGVLCVPVSGEPLYMVRKDFMRARMESGLRDIVPISALKDIPPLIADHFGPEPLRMGLELDVLPVTLMERYQALFPKASFSDATPMIRKVRMIKTHYEIHILQDAGTLCDKVYQRAAEVIREGMSDLELAAELEFCARKEGHQGLIRMRGFNAEAFYGQIFSGTDSTVPSYLDAALGGMGITPAFGQGAGYKRIARNEPIMVDFAGCFDGYLVDQTRMFVLGTLDDELLRAYDAMLKVQERMKLLAEERPAWGSLYNECLALAVELGYGDCFMGNRGAQVSFIGHGVGIELDEYPFIAKGFLDSTLEPGMVFAFEPKVVLPGKGAIGIENTFYLTESGLKQLTFSDQSLRSV